MSNKIESVFEALLFGKPKDALEAATKKDRDITWDQAHEKAKEILMKRFFEKPDDPILNELVGRL